MRTEDVREFVHRRPFRPFRVTLTDWRVCDIHHPEMAMVGRATVAIGLIRAGEQEPIYDRLVTVDLLHIMQIELIEAAMPAGPAPG